MELFNATNISENIRNFKSNASSENDTIKSSEFDLKKRLMWIRRFWSEGSILKLFKRPFIQASIYTPNEKANYKELHADFIEWRDQSIRKFELKCIDFTLTFDNKSIKEYLDLVNLPRCIKRITWEYCGCDAFCAKNLLSGLEYDKNCEYFNKKDFIVTDCNYLRLKYMADLGDNFPENQFMYKRNVFSKILKMCEDHLNNTEVRSCIDLKMNADCTGSNFCTDNKIIQPLQCHSNKRIIALNRDQWLVYLPSYMYKQVIYINLDDTADLKTNFMIILVLVFGLIFLTFKSKKVILYLVPVIMVILLIIVFHGVGSYFDIKIFDF